MKIIHSIVKLPVVCRALLSLLLLCGCLFAAPSSAPAATLDNACALLFEKLYANLAARGEIIAVLPDEGEVIIEFVDDLVPAYGAELLVFGSNLETATEESSPTLIFRGSVTVSETAGHLNRALVTAGSEKFSEGDQVFLPLPIQLYITPVKNLTPYLYFTSQATTAIARMLGTFPGIEVFNLAASNQKTVDFLMEKCRNAGRYGLIVQPYVLMQSNRSKVQLKLASLFSGHSLGVLVE
ncbi:MAG: hypothetical protein KAG92_03665, partial [Deltaproteobacteria bacterium]|nr:hypothetical protein [Deltaproteobacteria bacterium]